MSEKKKSNSTSKPKNQYMQDNKRDMHKIDEALYFVIEEKNNQVELTDNGIKYLLAIPIQTFSYGTEN
jgi:preprotein translocase subunit SecA